MISRYLAKASLAPMKRPVLKTPADYGMEYEDVSFVSEDGVRLKAWYIEGHSDKLMIFTHPMPFNRYGFHTKGQGLMKISDVEVELLKTVKQLHDAGYSVLTMDIRNHGESGKSLGGLCTIGYYEWQDVAAAMSYIRSDKRLKDKRIGMVVNCMGANAALQPVSYDIFLRKFVADKMPLVKGLLPRIGRQVKKLTGVSLADMSPLEYIPDVQAPVLFVQVRQDRWTVPGDIISFHQAAQTDSEVFWIEGDYNRFDGYNYFGDKPERMLAWLEKYM